MRPSRTVAIAALTAALALGSLPNLVGSREPVSDGPIEAAAFRNVILAAIGVRSTKEIGTPDPVYAAAGQIDAASGFSERGFGPAPAPPPDRVAPKVPAAPTTWDWKPPRSTVTGYATFYDNGTTAMRLPRGTIVVICSSTGCLERVVSDYGPIKQTRVVDMYRPDFFQICGCGWWTGTMWVTVRIY